MVTASDRKSVTHLRTWRLTGEIEVLTQLLIGGSDESLSIGSAADKSFIKDSINSYPYIPGSSLKGKLRSCLEEATPGKISSSEPHACNDKNCMICPTFGPHKTPDHNFGPTRLIVRDAPFSDESIRQMKEAQMKGKPYFGLKTENWIDRRTRVAGSPRTFETVPKSKFDFELLLRVYEVDGRTDKDEAFKAFIEKGLSLIEASYLGGSGSRGYGKVKFHNLKWEQIWPSTA